MNYQLPNGKTIYLTIEEYLNLTDEDIQYLVSLDLGESVLNPFKGSVINSNIQEKEYDFSFVINDEETEEESFNPFDDIVDLSDNLEK
jgi:hypothetical protein